MKISISNLKSMLITLIVMAVIGGLLVTTLPTFSTSVEPTDAPEVWVNDDWVVNASDDIVDGHTFGYDAFATIGDGIYNVASGGRVNVYPGTYAEQVSINKPLILNGSKSGIPGNDASRGTDEAIINASGSVTMGITVTSDDVVVDGFEIMGSGMVSGIYAPGVSNLAVSNTRVLESTSNGIYFNTLGSTLSDNYIANVPSGFYAIQLVALAGAPNTIVDNVIENCGNGVYYEGDGGTITGNTIMADSTIGNAINVAAGSDNIVIEDNYVYVDAYTSGLLRGTGDNANINRNVFIFNSAGCGPFSWTGDNANINDNYIGDAPASVGSLTMDVGAMAVPTDGMLYFVGNDSLISGNTIGGDGWMYPWGIAVKGNGNDVSGNNVEAGYCMYDAIYMSPLVELPVGSVTGNHVTINIIGETAITVQGYQAIVSDNEINANNIGDTAIYVEGSTPTANNNVINVANSVDYFVICVDGDDGSVCDNSIDVAEVAPDEYGGIIYYNGDFGIVDHNTLNAGYSGDEGIWYSGDNATITNNEINVDELDCDVIDYDGYGESGYNYGATITNNVIDCNYIDWAAICYGGPAGLIADNVISFDTAYVGIDVGSDEGMVVRDNQVTGDNVDVAIGVYCDEGMVSGNEIAVEDVDYCGIFYSGNAGNVIANYDYGEYLAEHPFIIYLSDGGYYIDAIDSPLFGSGHGVIKDNVGGSIMYMGDLYYDDWDWEYVYEPANYGTISNNTIDSYYVGITAYGDFNAIDNNTIKAVYGISSDGVMDTIADNTIDASYKADFIVPLSAGIGFDGDKNTVVRNEVYNASVGIFNVGMFTADDMPYLTSMPEGTSESVNGTLESIAANVTLLNGFADDYFGAQIAEAGVQASGADTEHSSSAVNAAATVTALDGMGYRGYGNVISDNVILNDWTGIEEFGASDLYIPQYVNLVGIASLGYDFVVDGNVIDNKNASMLLAGIIVGGDGGKVTDNEMHNISALGAYYGGLLEFNGGELVPSDLLGMDALISGNTLDNGMYDSPLDDDLLDGLLPLGIAFTGYNGDITGNDLQGVGIGIVTLQYAGSVADNEVDSYRQVPLEITAAGAPVIEGPFGIAGLLAIGDNMTVTGNGISNMTVGTLFAGLDAYSRAGNALIADNTLADNMLQMVYVPGNFLFNLDGAPAELNTATLLEVLDANTLDRAIYVTDDETGDIVEGYVPLPIFEDGLTYVLVFGDLNAASGISQSGYAYPGVTLNMRPGVYELYMPVDVDMSGMTFLGNPDDPASVLVNAGNVDYFETAGFLVYGDDTVIKGIQIDNVPAGDVETDISVGSYGIAVGLYSGLVYDSTFINDTVTNFTWGIYLDAADSVDIMYNKIKANGVGVYLSGDCDPSTVQIHYNDITDNLDYGVNNLDGMARTADYTALNGVDPNYVDATNNWWGSYTGPYHETLNSAGMGDAVTDYVLFEPWLNAPVFSSQYEYNLVPGWNLIGVPLDVPDNSIAGFFPAEVLGNIEVIWGWDEAAQDWVLYAPDPNEPFYYPPYNYPHLTSLETGRGYWVYMDEEAHFQVEGTVPDSAPEGMPMVSGWNSVSITGLCPQDVIDMYPDAIVVWGWDEAAQDWVLYAPDPNEPFYYPPYNYPHLTEVLPGYGYWVYLEEV